MHHILHKAQRTDKSAQQPPEQQCANHKAACEPKDFVQGGFRQYVKMAEQETSGTRSLFQVIRAGQHRKLHLGERHAKDLSAPDQQDKAGDHHKPADHLKSEPQTRFLSVPVGDPHTIPRHTVLLIQFLSQQHIQDNTDQGYQQDDRERQHRFQPAGGENDIPCFHFCNLNQLFVSCCHRPVRCFRKSEKRDVRGKEGQQPQNKRKGRTGHDFFPVSSHCAIRILSPLRCRSISANAPMRIRSCSTSCCW